MDALIDGSRSPKHRRFLKDTKIETILLKDTYISAETDSLLSVTAALLGTADNQITTAGDISLKQQSVATTREEVQQRPEHCNKTRGEEKQARGETGAAGKKEQQKEKKEKEEEEKEKGVGMKRLRQETREHCTIRRRENIAPSGDERTLHHQETREHCTIRRRKNIAPSGDERTLHHQETREHCTSRRRENIAPSGDVRTLHQQETREHCTSRRRREHCTIRRRENIAPAGEGENIRTSEPMREHTKPQLIREPPICLCTQSNKWKGKFRYQESSV
ncbi:uncharacterized protein [Procambarus clarkii]|uniref:uncharacterized protein n=1 Tax=Procambarus clarkii TaxID=6728 RepID=UPI003742FB55